MSASDAAPLPRAGEVFFDVRGDSRTMRVSWYADTGVAVFSIWHGGTCTGTFRLPIPELPRMVEALTRGPAGAAAPVYEDEPPEYGGAPYGYEDAPHGYEDAPYGYEDAPPAYEDAPPYEDGPAGYGDPRPGYAAPPDGGYGEDTDWARLPAGRAAPSGPLPVGQWHTGQHGGPYPGAGPPGDGYGAEDAPGYPGPDDLAAEDPLEADYGGEAEQGYLPGPPTETFSPVTAGRRAREYRPSRNGY